MSGIKQKKRTPKRKHKNFKIYNVGNKYGYRLNINNPLIYEYYERYKKWKNLNFRYPISDEQRKEFEEYMINFLKKHPEVRK